MGARSNIVVKKKKGFYKKKGRGKTPHFFDKNEGFFSKKSGNYMQTPTGRRVLITGGGTVIFVGVMSVILGFLFYPTKEIAK